jgi:uncharacterized protein
LSFGVVRALLDLNVLIVLIDEEHVHYRRAQQWWVANRTGGWASCPLTQNGFVRVLSQPGYSNPVPVAAAMDLLHRAASGRDHEFWADDISLLDLGHFDQTSIVGTKRLTDIYLLALAVKNAGRLATFDRAIPINAVRGAKRDHLVVI